MKDHHYVFRDRGCIEVKGKGLQHTYFLIGKNDKPLSEPDDDLCTLSILNGNDVKINGNDTILKEEHKNTSNLCIVL